MIGKFRKNGADEIWEEQLSLAQDDMKIAVPGLETLQDEYAQGLVVAAKMPGVALVNILKYSKLIHRD